MNLITNKKNINICIITATNEEKELYSVFDSDNTEHLTIFEAATGLGKFYGWEDKEGNRYAKEDAYIKPETPYNLFGIECGKGWSSIYTPLFEYINNYNIEHPEDKIEVEQVKEKFGGLRFYISHGPKELHDLIHEAESLSYKTCEYCGNTEDVGITVDGWYTTCCKNCIIEMAKSQNRNRKWRSVNDNKVYIVSPAGEFTEFIYNE